MSIKSFSDFPGYNRREFPSKIIRVTAGSGGEALLVLGSEETALIDCGMAYCKDGLIKNIREALKPENRYVDKIFLTHTHYDHIGALPYVLEEWPNSIVFGAEHCKKVFSSVNAREKIKELGEIAAVKYTGVNKEPIKTSGLCIHQVLEDESKISLGNEYIVALVTKGHTDCSVTYVLEPDSIMFTSESTGVIQSPDFMHVSILKSYKDSMESLEKCRNYNPRHIISPHYGMVPDFYKDNYWKMFSDFAEKKKDFIKKMYESNFSMEKMLSEYTKIYWNETLATEQPKEAFIENAKSIIHTMTKDYKKEEHENEKK